MRILVAGFISAALILFLVDRFFFESIVVISSSMNPTIFKNERIFLKKFFFKPPKRYDVVVISSKSIGHRVVKRVIGLPGECVELKDSWRVSINGNLRSYVFPSEGNIKEARIEDSNHLIQLKRNPKFDFPTIFGKTPLCLKEGEYYVLGDNRLASKDSRVIGPIQTQEIEGRLTLVWYSFDILIRSLRRDRMFKFIQ